VLDELKLRYKELELFKRLGICALLALLPGIYVYSDESTEVDEQYAQAEIQEKAAADKLLAAENKLKNLEKTQSQLEFTKDQLKKAEARLPEQVAIDEVLRNVGKISKEMSVNIRYFEPLPAVVQGQDYKYLEVPIAMTAEARDYAQLCEWVDRVAGGKSRIYIKSWVLERGRTSNPEDARAAEDMNKSLDPAVLAERQATAARDRVKVILKGQFSLYKMATGEQLAEAASQGANGTTPNQSEKDKAANSQNNAPAPGTKTQSRTNHGPPIEREGLL
jgi:Tfp pilus assembly protein PilO